jgi:uncharacterized damage-inducible protein DinB
MTTVKQMVQMDLRYSAWATLRLLKACTALSAEEQERHLAVSHGSVLKTLSHIYVWERFWVECLLADRIPPLDEIVNAPAPAPLRFDELVQWWPVLREKGDRWVATATDETLSQTLLFQLSSESQLDVARWQIVRHFVNHGTLHRGQIVGMIRAMGKKPPCVDFMEHLLDTRAS